MDEYQGLAKVCVCRHVKSDHHPIHYHGTYNRRDGECEWHNCGCPKFELDVIIAPKKAKYWTSVDNDVE